MTGPRVLVVEHAADCPPALVGDWLAAAGCTLDVARPYAGDPLPDPLPGRLTHDALLVLGGPMGAEDEDRHAWLAPTKELVRAAVAAGVPTLGICLGHQLVAGALGGTVAVNPRGQQLGLLEVGWTDAAADDPLVGGLTAGARRGVHWNNDVVTALPAGAVVLARTADGAVQAARFAPAAWGLQLHPEVTAEVLRPWAEDDRGSHEARGIDQERLLADIEVARPELEAAWAPVAHRFAELAETAGAGEPR
ncbi:type 1 glutamine amidotransferase [Nocardioides marmotae]|uniref:type 1 glutamine amidotransferase n=1 Tax=Nocardioides marmotae TaxID=2663857 RepID=UPI0012B5D897|nr:type 1 glutamine amidotransferase [Nocardioides marmotae]MBC9735272.1 type 1 glutamine amidotransferase [Nocardioides marmotae]MTB86372.1 type 1 glutamine amidotransferase [Nocardioides marmotae]